MSEVNWDLAPEGAVAVGQRQDALAFIDEDGHVFLNGHYGISMGWKTIATRPNQTKTVADAVEWQLQAGNEIAGYAAIGLDILTYCNVYDDYHFVSPNSEAGKGLSEHYQVIGTREQFEAYVKEKESEKWTHIIGRQLKCRIKHEIDGRVWLACENFNDVLASKSELKPIKPTISEEAVSKLRAYARWTTKQEDGFVSELVEEFIATHDITE